MSEYYTTETIEVFKPNLPKIKSEISEYLDTHHIQGDKYTLDAVYTCNNIDYSGQYIRIHIRDEDRNEPDEDLYRIDEFECFLHKLSEKCKAEIRLPSFYYVEVK